MTWQHHLMQSLACCCNRGSGIKGSGAQRQGARTCGATCGSRNLQSSSWVVTLARKAEAMHSDMQTNNSLEEHLATAHSTARYAQKRSRQHMQLSYSPSSKHNHQSHNLPLRLAWS